MRHLYVRSNCKDESLVCLLVNGESLPYETELVALLRQAAPQTVGVVLGVNTRPGNAILGDRYRTLWGEGALTDVLCGRTVRLSVPSFYQVNHHQAQRLYEMAISQAEITKADTVLDLYCGVGTITLAMAGAAGKVIGVEVVPQAVADARDNAVRNGITNAEFFCGDAGQAALELEKSGVRPDVVVVDPPRKGLNADTIEALHRMSPRRIVYVSCDPATLARDVALLKERGYALKTAAAADLFPRCAHVETVVTLSRKIPDDVIEVDLNLDELDITASESKATYPEIKEYVLQNYGLKVSSLYIAQTKRECGLEVGEHYNAAKPDGRPQPQMSPEKEAAIMAALKHFQMI